MLAVILAFLAIDFIFFSFKLHLKNKPSPKVLYVSRLESHLLLGNAVVWVCEIVCEFYSFRVAETWARSETSTLSPYDRASSSMT